MSEEYKPINNLYKDSEGYRYFGTLKLSSKIKYNGDDFISLWEWVEQLQQENQQLKAILENTIGIVEHNRRIHEHILKERALQIQVSAREEEYKKLEQNWKKLKAFIANEIPEEEFINNEYYVSILDKMQELERVISDVED